MTKRTKPRFMNQLGRRIARARGEDYPKKRRKPPSRITIGPVKIPDSPSQPISVEIKDETKGTEDPSWEPEEAEEE
ncbi:hypothetical protein ES703_56765 [subsurface metagenome]